MPLELTPIDMAPQAPPLHVQQWFGAPTTLGELRGRVVVVHAFQMLCPGCILHGMPQAARIHRTFSGDEVVVLGLHTVFEHHDAMKPVSLEAFLHEFRVPFPVAVDLHEPGKRLPQTMATYQLRGTPSLLLIDRRGHLRATLFGQVEDLALGAAIARLAAETS